MSACLFLNNFLFHQYLFTSAQNVLLFFMEGQTVRMHDDSNGGGGDLLSGVSRMNKRTERVKLTSI